MDGAISYVRLCRNCNKTYIGNEVFCTSCGNRLHEYSVDWVQSRIEEVSTCIRYTPDLQSVPIINAAISSEIPKQTDAKKVHTYNENIHNWMRSIGIPFFNYMTNWIINNTFLWTSAKVKYENWLWETEHYRRFQESCRETLPYGVSNPPEDNKEYDAWIIFIRRH